MSTQVQPTQEQIEILIKQALAEGQPHVDAVAFDDLCEALGDKIWGDIPGQNGLPDLTISSHIREVAEDKQAHFRILAVAINWALNKINPLKGVGSPDAPALGHGIGAEAGDLVRALRVISLLMVYLKIPTITITAGEDPAKIFHMEPPVAETLGDA